MIPLNPAAVTTGIPALAATLYGTGYGPATVTMPDGEILNGHYRLIIGGAISNGFASASGPRGSAFASASAMSVPFENPFVLTVSGAHGTTMICNGSGGGAGHVSALCETNHGAQYQMMF